MLSWFKLMKIYPKTGEGGHGPAYCQSFHQMYVVMKIDL